MSTVRAATRSDIAVLSAMLGRAFADDPVWQWMFPRHPERMARMFALLLAQAPLPDGASEVATDGAQLLAGALWDRPGRSKVSLATQLERFPALVRALGSRTVPVLRGLGEIEHLHPPTPHWYLGVLGTDPSAQGRGLGAALLASGLSRCDRDRLPAYLESSKECNIPYYERFGFRLTGELRLRGGPSLWPMWREPA